MSISAILTFPALHSSAMQKIQGFSRIVTKSRRPGYCLTEGVSRRNCVYEAEGYAQATSLYHPLLRKEESPMSDNLLEQQQNQYRSPTEVQTLMRMRWCLLIAILILLLLAIAATVVVIAITRSLLSLSLVTPFAYILHRITKYLFPLDERRYLPKKAKIGKKAQKSVQVKQVDINGINITPQANSPGSRRLRASTRLDQGIVAVAQSLRCFPAGW